MESKHRTLRSERTGFYPLSLKYQKLKSPLTIHHLSNPRISEMAHLQTHFRNEIWWYTPLFALMCDMLGVLGCKFWNLYTQAALLFKRKIIFSWEDLVDFYVQAAITSRNKIETLPWDIWLGYALDLSSNISNNFSIQNIFNDPSLFISISSA